MNLIEGIQAEQKRVRKNVLPHYEDFAKDNPIGNISIQLISHSLDAGDRAIASGDVQLMLISLAELKEING